MKLNREQIIKAKEILEGAKVMVLNRNFDDLQSAIITAINALTIVKELTEENEKLNERLDREARCQYDLCGQIVNLRDDVKYIKADTVQKMREKLSDRSEFLLRAENDGGLCYVDFCIWFDEVASEILGEE